MQTISDEKKDIVAVVEKALNLQEIVASVTDAAAGGIATFIGTTRDNFRGKKVLRLEYEGYIPMAKKEMKKLCILARAKWDLYHIAIWHRLGVVNATEASVIIACSSVHRKESMEAVHYLIDTLKATVPIWKLEVYEGDDRVWKENSEWHSESGKNIRTMKPEKRPAVPSVATHTNAKKLKPDVDE